LRAHDFELDAHALAGADALDGSAGADVAVRGCERHLKNRTDGRRLGRADEEPAKAERAEARHVSHPACLPDHCHTLGQLDARVAAPVGGFRLGLFLIFREKPLACSYLLRSEKTIGKRIRCQLVRISFDLSQSSSTGSPIFSFHFPASRSCIPLTSICAGNRLPPGGAAMDRQRLSIGLILITLSCGGAYILAHSVGVAGPHPVPLRLVWPNLSAGTKLIVAALFVMAVYVLGKVIDELVASSRR
jgi:hypothetical protein